MQKNKTNTVEDHKKESILERDISDLMDKIIFILRRSVFFIITLTLLITILVNTPLNYLSEDELVFEEYTFISYEYIYHDQLRWRDSEDYRIYVEEYDDYLTLSDAVFNDIDTRALANLKSGDKITVSIVNKSGRKFLCSFSYGDRYVLSYEDYLSASYESDKTIHQICTVGILFATLFPLIELIYKKVKGKSLYWPDENDEKTKLNNKPQHNKPKHKKDKRK